MKLRNTKRCAKQSRYLGTRSRKVRARLLLFAVGSLLTIVHVGGVSRISAQGASPDEYSIKAAFLFHFAKFVEWPKTAFSNADSPLVYCMIGEDPFQGALDASLRGKSLGTRAFLVRHLKEGEEAQGCHVVFIGKSAKKNALEQLANLRGYPVLTVGETEQFVRDNGMIGFCMEENKIRFDVNLEAAERANLKISAKLLTLARTVVGKPKRD